MQQQEIDRELIRWWKAQTFPHKDLFRVKRTGEVIQCNNKYGKDRVIATVTLENADIVLKTLCEKFAEVEAKVKELEEAWVKSEEKLRLKSDVSRLKEYLQIAHAIGNYEPFLELVIGWEAALVELAEENNNAKLKLVEQAESLADSEQWTKTLIVFKDIADKWKYLESLNKTGDVQLWRRIEKARDKFYERKKRRHEELGNEKLINLDGKVELVEEAEKLAHSQEWKKTTEAFDQIVEKWKTVGHISSEKNEELWQRIANAKKIFYAAKKKHGKEVKKDLDKNYLLKLALAEKAESLKDTNHWNATAKALIELTEEWKKIGPVPHAKSDEIWKRFSDAKDHFFEAKHRHTESVKAVLEENYRKKSALLQRAEAIKNSTRWGEATGEMNDLFARWKEIGPVAHEYGDEMWKDFLAARKHFFARKDEDREERKEYFEKQKVDRQRHKEESLRKLQRDIEEEKKKIIDFEEGLNNITPGRKAEELRAHLKNLIAECEARIKQMTERLKTTGNELKGAKSNNP